MPFYYLRLFKSLGQVSYFFQESLYMSAISAEGPVVVEDYVEGNPDMADPDPVVSLVPYYQLHRADDEVDHLLQRLLTPQGLYKGHYWVDVGHEV